MDLNPKSTARFMGHPIHPMLVPYPIAFFSGALVADLLFWRTTDAFWARMGMWLIAAGIALALLAAVAGLTDFLGERRIRALRDAWVHMLGNLVLVGIEAANLLLRVGHPAAPLPTPGLYLSGAGFLLLGLTGWKGGELVFGHRVGVSARSGPAD